MNDFDCQNKVVYISRPIRTFYSEKALISFLADNVKTHGYMDSARWELEYFDNLNIAGSDLKAYIYTTIKDGNLVTIPKYSYRLYYFYNSSGKVIDIRNYKNKVFRLVYARLSNLVNENNNFKRKKDRNSPISHTCCSCRKKVKYIRTARLASIPEYAEYIPADEKKLKMKYYDDFWSRKDCSWKRQFKCKHQWEKHFY